MTNSKATKRPEPTEEVEEAAAMKVNKAVNKPQASQPGQPKPPPTAHPKFGMREIREAIPKECFERNTWTSMQYVLCDLALVGLCGYAASYIETSGLPLVVQWGLWVVYWLFAGNFMTGLWVIAHECGHQAFSPHRWVNNTVGTILHSALLVPFHPWRVSHGNHHKYCCSIENDEVFVPSPRSALAEALEESPLASLIGVFNMLVFGWPLYLCCNVVGPAKHRGKINDHYNPWSSLFEPNHFWLVVQSDIALLAALVAFGWAIHEFGFMTVAAYYIVPYLIVNSNLVGITYLQHTDVYIPHYREGAFTPIRGKLSTVDRSFGIMNLVWHRITDTHVLHHIDHTIPHYNAKRATEAIIPVLGEYYLRDDSPYFSAMYRSWRNCRCVPDDGDIVWYVGADNDEKKRA
jgi:omega-6 fatty acid desaturase / acyl-lipid omega-6 desaturase (Delta-12 desaturase)